LFTRFNKLNDDDDDDNLSPYLGLSLFKGQLLSLSLGGAAVLKRMKYDES